MNNWYRSPAGGNGIAVSSRIRLARNVRGLPFPAGMDASQMRELNKRVKEAVLESNTPFASKLKYIAMDQVPENQVFAMVERHVISREFAANRKGRGIVLSDDESISVMVGEEDHIRIQVVLPGLQLEKAYEIAEQLDSLLCDQLHFAFDERLGFLTECPTNLGTGLRASVMLHLPLLETTDQIQPLSESVSKIGFTVRGMYGEGTKALASLYQVSNQITLGLSEKNAIDNLTIITNQLIDKELGAAERLDRMKLEDIVMRALGTLKYCRVLSSDEMMKLLSRIQLGESMGILKCREPVMKHMIEGQPHMLMLQYGELTPEERDHKRAELMRNAFASEPEEQKK